MSTDDPFDQPESVPAISFKDAPIGTTYDLEVLEQASLVHSRDFESGEKAFWPDGNPKMSAVLRVKVHGGPLDGEERSLWAAKPSSMLAAVSAAQKAIGKRLDKGDRLLVKLDGTKPNAKNSKLNDQKLYKAKAEANYYRPAETPADDPFADEPPF